MIVTTKLEREFVFKQNQQDVVLADPDPGYSLEQVINFYSGSYPILTTAKLENQGVVGDKVQYRYSTTLGTKG